MTVCSNQKSFKPYNKKCHQLLLVFFFDGHINLKDDSPIKKNLNTFLIKKKNHLLTERHINKLHKAEQ